MITYEIIYEPVTIGGVEYPKYNIVYYEDGVQILKEFHSTDGINGVTRDIAKASTIKEYTENVDASLTDVDCVILMNSNIGTVYRIPEVDEFPIGSKITVIRTGDGSVDLDHGSAGNLVNAINGFRVSNKYSVAYLMKIATDKWVASGDLN